MALLRFLICALVFIIPLFPLQLDTRIIFVISGLALSLYKIFIKNFTQDLQDKNPITIFFLLFLIASMISTIFSIDRERSLFTLLLYFSCFIIFTSIRSVFSTQKSKILLVTCCLLPVAILSLIALYNTLILNYVNKDPGGLSFMWIYFGHNHLANLLVFAIPLSIFFWKFKPLPRLHTTYYILLTIFLVFSLLFTMSRAGMFALFFAFVLGLAFYGKELKITKLKLVILVSVAILFTLTFNILAGGQNFIVTKGKIKLSEGYNRIVYWQQALQNFKEHPIWGSGLNTFQIVNARAEQPKKIARSSYAHNFFLQMLSDIGIFGFLSSIGLVGSVLWQSARKLLGIRNLKLEIRNLYLALFIGLLASTFLSMLDVGWEIPYVFMLFWIFTAL